MAKVSRFTAVDDIAQAIPRMIDKGTEVINMSFGQVMPDNFCETLPDDPICSALKAANDRDILMISSVGNDKSAVVEFPASDPRVVGVGGISPDGSLWAEACTGRECGSNYGPQMELMAPAKPVLSTAYTDKYWNNVPGQECGDPFGVVGTSSDGYGTCGGTSVASMYITGLLAHPDTVNPLLNQLQIREISKQTASLNGVFDSMFAYGIPNAAKATREALGYVGGRALLNRVTPFFAFYYSDNPTDPSIVTSLFTSSPQRSAAAVAGNDGLPFTSIPPEQSVPDYSSFPGAPSPVPSTQIPRAYVYVFTTPNTPMGQTYNLRPIYRLSKDPLRPGECRTGSDANRWAFAYAFNAHEVETLSSEPYNYDLEAIEGYLIDPSTAPIPPGAVTIHRRYSSSYDDWILVPQRVIDSGRVDNYEVHPEYSEFVGLAIANKDSDGDAVVDGFEEFLGTNPAVADSDGDGVDDGDEILGHTGGQAPPGGGVLGDPLCTLTRCHLFMDGFETGDTTQWSSATL